MWFLVPIQSFQLIKPYHWPSRIRNIVPQPVIIPLDDAFLILVPVDLVGCGDVDAAPEKVRHPTKPSVPAEAEFTRPTERDCLGCWEHEDFLVADEEGPVADARFGGVKFGEGAGGIVDFFV
ncbi:hypothetical protein O988_05730 [Pseudogymnoascus sp. VKM F-3808]|nr:hypothetical protein O988_05730 [Pseudogymnoascus sp. VKM F-3808]